MESRFLDSPRKRGKKGKNWFKKPEVKFRCSAFSGGLTIVNGGKWLGIPANIKAATKKAKIYVGKSTTLHILFCSHTLCMNYVFAMFLLVSCMDTRNQILHFIRFCARSTPK